jgi:DNA-binding beta-propeller fold protein YncE
MRLIIAHCCGRSAIIVIISQQESVCIGGMVASNPFALAAAPDDSTLYVADGASGRVLRVALDEQISVLAALPQMPPLTGLAFGPDGKLYFISQ